MPRAIRTGGQLLFRVLEQLGVRVAFGLPATQTVPLYEALRTSRLKSVVTTHELAATFAAVGYYRASGRPAVVLTMPGPGLTYAMTGLAEARQDSAALLLVVVRPYAPPAVRPERRDAVINAVTPLVKEVLRVTSADTVAEMVVTAYERATTGEPGPVVIELAPDVVVQPAAADDQDIRVPAGNPLPRHEDILALADRIRHARLPLVILGQGAADAGDSIHRLVTLLGAPVVTTGSGRGCLPEDHSHSLAFDPGIRRSESLTQLVERSDLLLVFGSKFAYSGSGGLWMALPPDKVVMVDASEETTDASSRTSLAVRADVPVTIAHLARLLGEATGLRTDWTVEDLACLREQFRSAMAVSAPASPVVRGINGGVAALVRDLRPLLPRDACIVTDSGLHQMLIRAHWTALGPRGLLTPANFQSMGFGLPAALGASLACPERRVVVALGDGGLTMSGMELLTAAREAANLVVLIFNDGGFGLIRNRQLEGSGVDFAVNVQPPDLESFAAAVGVDFLRVTDATGQRFRDVFTRRGAHLIEIPLRQTRKSQIRRARNHLVESIRATIGRGRLSRIKRRIGIGHGRS